MNHLARADRVVVKIGSSLLCDPKGALHRSWLADLARDIADLRQTGCALAIVSSGAIALGRHAGGFGSSTPLTLEQSQAAAAIGQIKLARAYEEALEHHGICTAQILLTLDDGNNRQRFLNSRATMATLLAQDVVPICNENDSVATDEIRFGDNDRLAAQVAVMINADALILLSDVDGFYTDDPRRVPGARHLKSIPAITPEIIAMAGPPASPLSRGGMQTKLDAAHVATNAGCALAIADGRVAHPLTAIHSGSTCTWFEPTSDPETARKQWIASMKPKGRIIIDAGARRALDRGKSLLPAGVLRIEGTFDLGDVVEIVDTDGNRFGCGLTRYTSAECERIAGMRSAEIATILHGPARSALIHRNDMSH
ncbi:MAG: glutamate 5-kinase [Rhodobacteraceae bacterium]|nr:glutamate 5-kinase [Paracoccaceae bacterium]